MRVRDGSVPPAITRIYDPPEFTGSVVLRDEEEERETIGSVLGASGGGYRLRAEDTASVSEDPPPDSTGHRIRVAVFTSLARDHYFVDSSPDDTR